MEIQNEKISSPPAYYVRLLTKGIEEKKKARVGFSNRLLAKKIGVSPSIITRILNGERMPSFDMLKKLSLYFGWSSSEIEAAFRSANERKIETAVKDGAEKLPADIARALDDEHFLVMGDWRHLAALELTQIPDFKLTPDSLSASVQIPVAAAREIIERLVKIEMLRASEVGGYEKVTKWYYSTERHRTKPANRALALQLIENARSHVEHTEWGKRLNYWGVYAIDPESIPKIQPLIEQLLVDIEGILGSPKRSQVYSAGFYLCPIGPAKGDRS